MQVKIFTGFGKDGIANMEKEINLWLRHGTHKYKISNTQTAMCQVAEKSEGERYQCMSVTIWYNDEI